MYILIHVKFNAAEGTKLTVTVEIVHSAIFRVIFLPRLEREETANMAGIKPGVFGCIWLLWHLTYLNRA